MELKYNNNREEVYTNSNELSEVLKQLATKIGQIIQAGPLFQLRASLKLSPILMECQFQLDSGLNVSMKTPVPTS